MRVWSRTTKQKRMLKREVSFGDVSNWHMCRKVMSCPLPTMSTTTSVEDLQLVYDYVEENY